MTRPLDRLPPLPVDSVVGELRAALSERRSAVLTAEPGAGKTTLVPLRLMDEPWLAGRRIMMLEPRRVAARAAARRLADLLGEPVGASVGFRTRDEVRVGPHTRVEVVTEGILTRRLQNDPALEGVGLVIFDEFHERSLPADLGLALALEARRSLGTDLAVLVMSATIDTARIAALLDDPPALVISSPGRTHPVEVRWRPPRPSANRRRGPRRAGIEASEVLAAVRAGLAEGGDLLVFLPGVAEIRRVAAALSDTLGPEVSILELHGGLSAAEQDEALAPALPGTRKVVLSTDLAETSLTVEGVGVVIDAGEARVPRFDAGTGMTRLVTVAASRASADQRAGRAGRLGPGVAIRLWSQLEHRARPAFSPAEITQVDMAGLALELAVWGVDQPAELPLLDQPARRSWEQARELLAQLGALVEGRPTPLGRAMAELPLHPRLARMVLMARDRGQGATACLVAALLDDRDVLRGRPDEVPVDLGLRLGLLIDPARSHPAADGRALGRARRRAEQLADRVGLGDRSVEIEAAGPVLALAYPDRLAMARARSRGRFLLRSGSGAWVHETDPLADAGWLVAADLDGRRRESRIRLAAALDEAEVIELFGAELAERRELIWDERDELVERVERRLDALRLTGVTRRPPPGDEVVAALVARVRRRGLDELGWTPAAEALRDRVAFCRSLEGDDWPDFSDGALTDRLDEWLAPFLVSASGRADLGRVDVAGLFEVELGFDRRSRLDELAPAAVTVPSGRSVSVDYGEDPPVMRVRVQEMFGSGEHPCLAGGRVPLVVHLLSPAGRPVQVTSDLAGFWTGSWHEVRKDMAGRYPKHDWPLDPLSARPSRR